MTATAPKPSNAPRRLAEPFGEPDAPHLSLLADVDFQPVFIMGEHRSGTTLLYKLLGLSGAFNIVQVYHLLCYDSLLANHLAGTEAAARRELDDLFATRGLSTRLIDNMPLNSETPEEYGILLHRRGQPLRLKPKNIEIFREFCRKLQFTGDPTRLLLLKNPFDFDNAPFVLSAFPKARFVYIHRHPIHILNSQLKAMRQNWTEGNPYNELLSRTFARLSRSRVFRGFMRLAVSPTFPTHLALRLLVRRGMKMRAAVRRQLAELPPERFIRLRYEDLCQEPDRHIGQILDFLNTTPRAAIDYGPWIAKRSLKLLPDIAAIEDKLCRRLGCGREEPSYEV
jgi:hypothetical protein